MSTVTAAFARALASAAGLAFTDDGQLLKNGSPIREITTSGDTISVSDYFDLVDWIRRTHPDRVGLPLNYARAVDIDNLGALGLAIKTAPTLRESLQRAERYFRLLTDTVSYRLDEHQIPAQFILRYKGEAHAALELRNECALCGFGRVFKEIVGPDLTFEYVSFTHAGSGDVDRYQAFLGCPVLFGAQQNAIAIRSEMLDLPTRLGDAAVSRFLTAHLDSELGTLPAEPEFERSLARHLSEALSNGIPKASAVARAIGMSERTLYRRLADTGLTYQDMLENTQKTLAENLLSGGDFSIAEVAFLTGFSEQSSFSRAFKRWVGQTPGSYRRGALPA